MDLAVVNCVGCQRALAIFGPDADDRPVCCVCAEAEPATTPAFHGHSRVGNRSPENQAWGAMRQRCNNPRDRAYRWYGARGIKVCERWSSFKHFLADMGPRPSDAHSLDRIDNDGDYTPANCRWILHSAQMRNTRANRMLTHDGVTLCLTEWAMRKGMKPKTLHQRLLNGWSVADAIESPVVRGWKYAERKAAA